ncbi:MAG: phosphatase PAP2 family protein, partial [Candidatus Kaiserbacteria bacterium]|nr:phosphatase PAP2 family protein [Candidatus Kaiserbacteria bacterium]
AIGFSRLYLGVHYISDVVAGYLLGGIFVIVGIKISRKLRERPISALK